MVTRISKRSAWTIDHGQWTSIVEDDGYAPEKTIATRLSGTAEALNVYRSVSLDRTSSGQSSTCLSQASAAFRCLLSSDGGQSALQASGLGCGHADKDRVLMRKANDCGRRGVWIGTLSPLAICGIRAVQSPFSISTAHFWNRAKSLALGGSMYPKRCALEDPRGSSRVNGGCVAVSLSLLFLFPGLTCSFWASNAVQQNRQR